MKVSYLGIALLLLGVVVIGSAYAGYPLSVVSTPSLSYTGSANVLEVSSIQASNGSIIGLSTLTSTSTDNNPWIFGQFSFVPITVQYYFNYTFYVSRWASPASGTIDVTATVINESSGQTTQHTVPVSIAVSISFYKLRYNGLYVYYATITSSGTFILQDPYSISTNSAVYGVSFSSGSGTISYGNTSYMITLNPSQTVYGEFIASSSPPPSSYITNFPYGNFWVGTSLNSMTKIVSLQQTLNLNVASFPATLYVVFVFNGSIPSNYINVYYMYRIYNNSATPMRSGIVNFYNQPTTSVTINGQSYPYAFVSSLNISGPSDIMLLGSYATSEYSVIPIMEIGGFSDNAPVQPAFSTQQYISFGIGAVLILIGLIWILKK